MKKVFILFSIVILILIISDGIMDSSLILTNDINDHLWLNLVGRWQSSESTNYEIKFNPDGTFNEYYYGAEKGYGNYKVFGNNIIINYDILSCQRENKNSCTVNMKLYFEIKTIKLINNENKMIFNKVIGK